MTTDACLVYGLLDPETNELRYVGKTVGAARRRLAGHVCDAKRGATTHCARWIRSLLDRGLTPEQVVLEYCTSREELGNVEREWIAKSKAAGARLTNLTDGGDGGLPGWKPSAATLAKFRARRNVWRGRRHTAESKARMSASLKALWASSPELKRQQSERHRGKTISESVRQRQSESSRALWKKPGMRAQIRASRQTSAACRLGHERRAAALRGRRRDPRAVARTAAACQKRIVDSLGREYGSLTEASRVLGVSIGAVSDVLNGRRPAIRGLAFTFVERQQPATSGGR